MATNVDPDTTTISAITTPPSCQPEETTLSPEAETVLVTRPTQDQVTSSTGTAGASVRNQKPMDGYYIRGVFVPTKSTTPSSSSSSTGASVRDTDRKEVTSVRSSAGYKPWQMRSWGSGTATVASTITDTDKNPDTKPTKG